LALGLARSDGVDVLGDQATRFDDLRPGYFSVTLAIGPNPISRDLPSKVKAKSQDLPPFFLLT